LIPACYNWVIVLVQGQPTVIDIQVSLKTQTPIYAQLVEQITLLIENRQVQPGDRLPTVRDLSRQLGINPTTVARAYRDLELAGLLEARCRRGTVVLRKLSGSPVTDLRRRHLTAKLDQFIRQALSLGFHLEELESAFNLQLNRNRFSPASPSRFETMVAVKTLNIVGSNDLALDLLINRLKYQHPDLLVKALSIGSTGGLQALREGQADIAGLHLLDPASGEYNLPFIRQNLQGIETAVVRLADRIQGLIVAKGNPRHIRGLRDLVRPDIVFINRQPGSGTRLLLDYQLAQSGISGKAIRGYTQEKSSHLEVALGVERGRADVALGIRSAANSCDLDFIPLARECFDLVTTAPVFHSRLFADLLYIIRDEEFKRVVNGMGGYDISHTGEMQFVT
jgi:molybdate-binding protein/DNA-binding transcriptional regulator YhcF (GntR family)